MKSERYLLVAYDIKDDSTRTRLARTLMYHGLVRLQFSVFSGPVTAAEKSSLMKEIEKIELGGGDKVQIIDLCQRCVENRIIIGDEPERPQHMIF